jgi:hypothetical protein
VVIGLRELHGGVAVHLERGRDVEDRERAHPRAVVAREAGARRGRRGRGRRRESARARARASPRPCPAPSRAWSNWSGRKGPSASTSRRSRADPGTPRCSRARARAPPCATSRAFPDSREEGGRGHRFPRTPGGWSRPTCARGGG